MAGASGPEPPGRTEPRGGPGQEVIVGRTRRLVRRQLEEMTEHVQHILQASDTLRPPASASSIEGITRGGRNTHLGNSFRTAYLSTTTTSIVPTRRSDGRIPHHTPTLSAFGSCVERAHKLNFDYLDLSGGSGKSLWSLPSWVGMKVGVD